MSTREKPFRLAVFPPEGFGSGPAPVLAAGLSAAVGGGAAGGLGTGEQTEQAWLQVGELAKATGKTVRAIHLYEELGLLKAHERSKGRYRLFTEEAVVRVRWIVKMQSLGLSLTEIQELVREQEASGTAQFAASRLREVYRTKLVETRNKLSELRALEAELEESLAYLDACDTACQSELPVHSCPSCERHPERPNAPELVAGVHVN
ncbi:MAG: MerR family transcriptional regulator [Myxococcota bacterium]